MTVSNSNSKSFAAKGSKQMGPWIGRDQRSLSVRGITAEEPSRRGDDERERGENCWSRSERTGLSAGERLSLHGAWLVRLW